MVHWPEIHKYCGCMSLNVGVVVKIISDFLVTSFFIVYTVKKFAYLVNAKSVVDGWMADEEFIANHTKAEIDALFTLFIGFFVYFTMWMLVKILNFLILILVIYGLWKAKPILLRLHVYNSVFQIVFDIVVALVTTILRNILLKIFTLVYILFQFYHIFIISTVHKKITGTSKLVTEDTERQRSNAVLPPTGFVSPPHRPITFYSSFDTGSPHCSSCTCLSPSPTAETAPLTSATRPTLTLPIPENKNLNFKEEVVIFNQEILTPGTSPVIEDASNSFGRYR